MTKLGSLGRFIARRRVDKCAHDVVVVDRVKRVVVCEVCLAEVDPIEVLLRCGGFNGETPGKGAVQPGADGDKDGTPQCASVHYLRPKG